jgi:2-polyprenyl-3-methyl-5-hydroxy-6-metoxy-1,4-benzoquinol methylase
MKLSKRISCPLCQQSDFERKTEASFDSGNLQPDNFKITDNQYGNYWDFYKCQNCDFVFSNPYLDEKNIIEFYSKLKDKSYGEEARGREKNFIKILNRLKKLKVPGRKLLDIGAASGIFLNIARKQGFQVEGIEPSESLVEQAMKSYNIELHRGTVGTFSTRSEYSVITLLDILEHLPEPDSFFARISQFLKKDGILVIVTPDINSLTARFMKNRWWHYRIAHVNFFNLKSIEFLLKKYNFTILKKKRFAWNFSLYYLISRIFPFKENRKSTLQNLLKNINLKIQLLDSLEIYARKN